VPTLVVSPFTRNSTPNGGPLVSSDLFDHTSLLRFIETWAAGIGKPAPIVNRDAASKTPGLSPWRRGLVGDLTSAINFAGGRDATVPGFLTDPAQVPNRVDPTVLTECIITGTIGTLSAQTSALPTPYPVPATNTMPHQEALTAAVKRPSGPVAGQAACPTPTTSNANPNPIAVPGSQLPTTSPGFPKPLVTAGSVAGGVALAGAWWSRRVRANRAAATASEADRDPSG
jgi:phospholipase C